MANKLISSTIVMISLCLLSPNLMAEGYGQTLCHNSAYSCLKVKGGESWASLFPDPEIRLLVKKVNRMNTPIHRGMIIAVPKNLDSADVMNFAPFPHKISPPANNLIKVDLKDLAWGAYDSSGNLVNWGPVSGGRSYCPDIKRGCGTITGTFTVFDKQGPGCISHRFPLPHGGAPMPYCMHFHGGYALHASATVPGFNASHGCVRMFLEDAQWLNQVFVELGSTRVQIFH